MNDNITQKLPGDNISRCQKGGSSSLSQSIISSKQFVIISNARIPYSGKFGILNRRQSGP